MLRDYFMDQVSVKRLFHKQSQYVKRFFYGTNQWRYSFIQQANIKRFFHGTSQGKNVSILLLMRKTCSRRTTRGKDFSWIKTSHGEDFFKQKKQQNS